MDISGLDPRNKFFSTRLYVRSWKPLISFSRQKFKLFTRFLFLTLRSTSESSRSLSLLFRRSSRLRQTPLIAMSRSCKLRSLFIFGQSTCGVCSANSIDYRKNRKKSLGLSFWLWLLCCGKYPPGFCGSPNGDCR